LCFPLELIRSCNPCWTSGCWLGWLRLAGFNGLSKWRSLYLLWLPGLLALFYLSSFFLSMHVSGARVVVLAALVALLNSLSEEARFRGVILQALLPYGWLRAAALSAVFFGLAHLTQFLVYPPLLAFEYVVGAFALGFGYAACRLRTNTIWPLIIFHACGDLFPNFTVLNGGGRSRFL
jgi:membrane protease YdiL (CAAX protease family)